ncbi:MAG TPA: AMP-binding protein, partial [Humisphaera sp.]|nr:AMP-binding protein [Humisphaera sp.]
MTRDPIDPIAWRPSPELIAGSHLQRFMNFHGIATLDELQRRSTTDISWFWDAVLKDLGIRFHTPYSQVVDLSRGIGWPRWCVGGEMNIVANLLDRYEGTEVADKPAIKWEGEDGAVRVLSYRALNEEVSRMAFALRSLGLGRSDVIGVLMPMVPEIVIAMLAIIKIGGIFLPLFSGYGAGAVSQRLNDAGAKALFTADGFRRKGKAYHLKVIADEAVLQSPTVKHVIVLRHLGNEGLESPVAQASRLCPPAEEHIGGAGATSKKRFHNPDAGSAVLRRAGSKVEESDSSEYLRTGVVREQTGCETESNLSRDYWWHELVANAPAQSPTEITGADETMMILYTSGTTGKPKGAVHTHCGFPIKAAQDLLHGFDLHQDETLYWVTDMGWMMGPWLVFGTLLIGATMVLYDGALDYPGPNRLWQMVERHRVTTLGISPTLVRLLMQAGEAPVRAHDLSSLQKFGSTGEPWNPEPWHWLFDVVGAKKLPIINYSGGTEISGGILGGNVLSPLKPCA